MSGLDDAEVDALYGEVRRLRELVRNQNQLARELVNARDERNAARAERDEAEGRVGELTTERDHLSVKYSELVSAVDPDTYPSGADVPDDTISVAEQQRLLDLAATIRLMA